MPRRVVPICERAEVQLRGLVEHAVPGHDEVRVARDAQALGRAAARRELVELLAQHLGVEHDAVAEHAELAREEDAARQQPELERLLADLHGVPGVVAALVARDDGERLGQQVDDLALALVAPLGADDDGRGRCGRAHRGRVDAGTGALRAGRGVVVDEARVARLEAQVDRADGPVAVLGDVQLGEVVGRIVRAHFLALATCGSRRRGR